MLLTSSRAVADTRLQARGRLDERRWPSASASGAVARAAAWRPARRLAPSVAARPRPAATMRRPASTDTWMRLSACVRAAQAWRRQRRRRSSRRGPTPTRLSMSVLEPQPLAPGEAVRVVRRHAQMVAAVGRVCRPVSSAAPTARRGRRRLAHAAHELGLTRWSGRAHRLMTRRGTTRCRRERFCQRRQAGHHRHAAMRAGGELAQLGMRALHAASSSRRGAAAPGPPPWARCRAGHAPSSGAPMSASITAMRLPTADAHAGLALGRPRRCCAPRRRRRRGAA